MLQRLKNRLPIERDEWTIVLLMLFYIYGVLTFYYVLKPLKNALFLESFPADDLPYAYFLTAFVAGGLATLFFKLSRRVSAISFLTATNVLIIASLFFFRWALGQEIKSLPYIYYVYINIVAALSTSQFWLLAGYIFDSQQSKRVYPVLGAGAIAGSMSGSAIPGFLSERLSMEAMLLICMAIIVALILLSQAVWRFRRPESETGAEKSKFGESHEKVTDLARLVFGSRHLTLIALLIFLTLIASQLAEWQVNDAAESAYADLPKEQLKAKIGALWGQFYFYTNILGIVLQLTLAGFVLRNLGIGAAILLLPLALLVSSFGVLIAPMLATTVVAMGSNAVFRYSINKLGMELLYLPLSPEVRKKIKLFLDVFVDRLGRGVAGVLILVLIPLRGTAGAIIVLTAACILVAVFLRRSYVESFRQKLATSEVDLSEINQYVTDPTTVQLLISTLGDAQERRILYSLRLLKSISGVDFSKELLPLLEHSSPYIREEATRTMGALPGDHTAEGEALLSDPSERVRHAAVDYLCSVDPEGPDKRLGALLEHSDIQVRISAASCISVSSANFAPSSELVQSFMALDGRDAAGGRIAAAYLAGRLPTQESIRILRGLTEDPDPRVAAAAIVTCGSRGHLDLVFTVVSALARPQMRAAARESLLLYGHRVVGSLGDILDSTDHSAELRREIPWVLGRIPTKRSADILVEHLATEDPMIKYRVVKALGRLHNTKPELPEPRPEIASRVQAETQSYYEALILFQPFFRPEDRNGGLLLGKALRERLDQNLEIIFRLLGLQYPQKDIRFAYAAIKGQRTDRRKAAIEFLDNVLQKNLKSIILPLVEEASTERLVDRAQRLFGIETRGKEYALRLILQQPGAWLKVCALHQVGAERITGLLDTSRSLTRDADPLVRETAQWVVNRCE